MLFGFTSVLPVFPTNHIYRERLFTVCDDSGTYVSSESKSVLKFHFKMQSSSLASDLT